MNVEHFTQVPNSIMEALAIRKMTLYQVRIILAVARKTYGFGKEEDVIPNRQIAKLTGMKPPHVTRTMKELRAMNVVVTSTGKKIGLNPVIATWMDLPVEVKNKNGAKMRAADPNVTSTGNAKLPAQVTAFTSTGNKMLPLEGLSLKTKKSFKQTFQNKPDAQARENETGLVPVQDAFHGIEEKLPMNLLNQVRTYRERSSDEPIALIASRARAPMLKKQLKTLREAFGREMQIISEDELEPAMTQAIAV